MFEGFRQKCYNVLKDKAVKALDKGGIPEWRYPATNTNPWVTKIPLEENPDFMARPELMIEHERHGNLTYVKLVGRNVVPIISYGFRRIARAETPDTFYAEDHDGEIYRFDIILRKMQKLLKPQEGIGYRDERVPESNWGNIGIDGGVPFRGKVVKGD